MSTSKQTIASFSVPKSEIAIFEEFKTILKHQKLSLSGTLRDMIREYVLVHRESEYSHTPNEEAAPISQLSEQSEHPLKAFPQTSGNEVPKFDSNANHEHWSVAITQ
jgi:hypothetical protein